MKEKTIEVKTIENKLLLDRSGKTFKREQK